MVANCDHLERLTFSKSQPYAFTEFGAIMAATILKNPGALKMRFFVVRAFIPVREQLAANATTFPRLAEIDKTLLKHDRSLRLMWQKIQPLLAPPTAPPKPRIRFHREA